MKNEEIRTLVRDNDLKKACQILQDTILKNEGIIWLSQLQDLNKQSAYGLIEQEVRDRALNKIRFGLLSAAQSLEDIAITGQHQESTINKLIETGAALFSDKEYSAALDVYQRILQYSPKHIEALMGMGRTLDMLEQYESAIQAYKAILEIDPLSHRALNNLGVVYYELENYDTALQYYAQAIIISPRESLYFNNKVRLLNKLKRNSELVSFCSQSITKNPRVPIFYYERCKAYIDHFSYYEKALSDINTAISLESSNAEYFFERARAYIGLKKLYKAIANLDHCLFLVPNDLFYRQYKAAVLMDFKEFSEALPELCDLILAYDKEISLFMMQGICQYELGYYDSAISSFSISLSMDSGECDAYYYLELIYLKLGDQNKVEHYHQKKKACYDRKSSQL